ncbi:MAG: hypothetical protein U9Q19_00835, partial [Pseudomonadota bacterium]|nr:hypothetical protein [Pseudomonadota bacterium]
MEIENNRIASLVTQTSDQGTPVEKQGHGNTNSPSRESAATHSGSDRNDKTFKVGLHIHNHNIDIRAIDVSFISIS